MKVQPPEQAFAQHPEPRIAGLFALWLGAAVAGLFPHAAWAWDCVGRVVRIHDGDTLSVRCEGRGVLRIRIAGIDAPELRQAYGQQARQALAELSRGRDIAVRSVAVDQYQRVVAKLAVDGHDLGRSLVERGLAWCGRRPARTCAQQQAAARNAGLGLWRDPDAQAPWAWRQQNPRKD